MSGCGDLLVSILLAKHYGTVHVKPDRFWLPPLFGRTHREWAEYHRVLYGFSDLPILNGQGLDMAWPDWEPFQQVTAGISHPDFEKHISDNLKKYLRVAQNVGVPTVWERAAQVGFFSNNRIPNVVFVFRHPLHAFADFYADAYSQILVDLMGGPNSAKAVAMWGEYWARHAAEYVKCCKRGLNPVKVTYEAFACPECRRQLPWLNGLKERWKPQWPGIGMLPEPAQHLLRLHTRLWLRRIYGCDFGWHRVPRRFSGPIGCGHSPAKK